MNESSFLGLVHNVVLLLATALLFDLVIGHKKIKGGKLWEVPFGGLLGGIGITLMLTPWIYSPGIIFDTRSVLLGVSGLFFGTIPTVIAMVMTAAFRFYQGGAAVGVGVSVILMTGTLGILWRHLLRKPLDEINGWELYLFGLIIHIVMLACAFILPHETALQVLANISLPVMLIYPLGTLLLGLLITNRLRQVRITSDLRESENQLRLTAAELKKSERRYRLLTENIKDVVWVLDVETMRFCYVSPSVERLRGYTPEEILAEPISHALTAEDRESKIKLIRGRAEDLLLGKELPEKFYTNEVEQPCKDGSRVWTEVITSYYINPENGRVEVRGVTRDIAQRKQVEEKLLQEKIFSDAILASVPGLLYLYNEQGYLLRWNKQHEEITGYSAEELDHFYLFDWYKGEPEDIERISQGVQRALTEGFATAEGNLIIKDGSKILFDFTASRLEIGGKVYFTGIGIDITERRKAEEKMRATQAELQQLLAETERSRLALLSLIEDQKLAEEKINRLNAELEQRVQDRTAQLEAANKELEAFAYSVSHDLRAPLRALDGFSGVLLKDYQEQLDIQGQHYLARIQEASRRMGQLIEDLLNLSRVTRREMNREQVNLSKMALNIIAEMQEQDLKRRVEFDIAQGLIVYADPNLMQIVIGNLLHNAYKFTNRCEQACIQMGVERQVDELVYFVHDNGVGFDMAYVDKLFTPFQRLHSAQEFPGTGIGLVTVQRIISRHGGRIWTEAAPDQGATFYFTLGEIG